MVVFPPQFVAVKFPGYFWNLETKTLYTAKLGVLRELKRTKPSRFNQYFNGYKVCHNGNRRKLSMDYLNSLGLTLSVIPVEKAKSQCAETAYEEWCAIAPDIEGSCRG